MTNVSEMAAVGFDPTDQKFVVINSENLKENDAAGDAVDVDGRALTILKVCDTVEAAKQECENKASHMLGLNGMGIAAISYDDEPQSSSSGTEEKREENDLENETMEEGTVDGVDEDIGTTLLPQMDLDTATCLQNQIDNIRKTVRDAVAMVMSDFQTDLDRINNRQAQIAKFFEKNFGTGADGRVVQPFNDMCDSLPFNFGTIHDNRPLTNAEENIFNYFRENDYSTRQHLDRTEAFLRNNVAARKTSTNNNSSSSARPVVRKDNYGDEKDPDYQFGTSGTQGKRIVNGIVKTVDRLSYPFISREQEEECLSQANGQAPIFAQLLAKLLFADSIELYFKDQDTNKRNWLHDAVDYRFPTLDKPLHVSKWKNCSYFINKNMREAVQQSGNPMPKAPCGPRGPIGPKDVTPKPVLKEVQPKTSKPETSKSDTPKPSRHISRPPNVFKYLTAIYEKECFDECRGDQYKYAELMALKLFSDNLPAKFKEQDVTKKEWLRNCVESRFPIAEGAKNDQRWKICGQTCNKNRTKIVGADGREEKYPYFPQSVEEECFKKSGGIAANYAELMNTHLFPDSQHLFFKDQDIGKRHWLHSILDKRFPTDDKIAHVSKWKTCTNAINRKLFDGTVTPITREAVIAENGNGNASYLDETATTSGEPEEEEEETKPEETEEEEDEEQHEQEEEQEQLEDEEEVEKKDVKKNGIPKFERRLTENGLKRKLDEESEGTPTAKRESIRNKIKKEKELNEAYPFVSEQDEVSIFESCNGNAQVYGRELGKLLFKDTLKLYFKDQDVEKRNWIKEILDFRFPSKSAGDQKQKWKNVTAAINKNMVAPVSTSGRRSQVA